jgi:folate-binding protein YgfZ
VSEPTAQETLSLDTPLAAAERAEGAEFAEYFGVRLPAQFRDPRAEYRAAREYAALMDTTFRAVFALSGPDRVRYLNAVTSGNIRDLAPGQSALGLLLNAQGHMLAELLTLALEDRLLVLGHDFVRQRTFETLDKFIIMDDATLTDESSQTGTLAIEGPKAPEILREVTGIDLRQLPAGAHAVAQLRFAGGAIPCRILRRSQFGLSGAELLLPREALAAAWPALGAAVRARGGSPIGYRAIDILRLEAGIPWFGADFDEHRIPQEAGIESTHVSFTKGCYTGQEIVERVRSRGHVNRRLAGLAFSSAEAPKPGTAIFGVAGSSDGSAPLMEPPEAGHVTSAAFSPLMGKAIGMAYLRREYLAPGTKLLCGSERGNAAAEVIELPLDAAFAPERPEADL